jgi:hypothetical protein
MDLNEHLCCVLATGSVEEASLSRQNPVLVGSAFSRLRNSKSTNYPFSFGFAYI